MFTTKILRLYKFSLEIKKRINENKYVSLRRYRFLTKFVCQLYWLAKCKLQFTQINSFTVTGNKNFFTFEFLNFTKINFEFFDIKNFKTLIYS